MPLKALKDTLQCLFELERGYEREAGLVGESSTDGVWGGVEWQKAREPMVNRWAVGLVSWKAEERRRVQEGS